MLQTQPNKYMDIAVQTASPAKLLIMLYDGALRFCKQAVKCIQEKDLTGANNSLIKAQSIINEFRVTLDNSYPISQELHPIYEYFHYRLIQANIHKDSSQVEEVIDYLTQMREAWIEAAKSVGTEPLTGSHG